MKKVISRMLIIALLLTTFTYAAYAADTITVTASVVNSTKTVTITGNISSGEGKQVTVQVVNPSGGTDYINQTASGANGRYQFIYVLDESIRGTYTVTVGGSGISSPVSTTFTYAPSTGGGGGGGGGGGSATASPAPTATPAPTPVPEGKPVEIKVDTPILNAATGEAVATVTAAAIAQALSQAVADADGVKTVILTVPAVEGATAYVQQLPANVLSSGDSKTVIRVATELGTIAAPAHMLSASEVAGAQNVSLTIAKADTSGLAPDVQAQIGGRPVIELSLAVDGRQVAWNNPDAPVTVTIPYTPTAAERTDPEHITVWYIDGSGNLQSVPSGRYDPETGTVSFTTTHFSKYAVVFVKKTFNDIGGYDWARNAIEVMASKGIINGTTTSTYSPALNITRGDFMVLLIKTLNLSARTDDNFSDVAPSAHYYEAVAVAKKLGITTGVGNNRFNPGAFITRQEMMALVDRALNAAKKGLTTGTAADLNSFTDKDKIADYAVQSIAKLVRNGIITGNMGYINPLGNTTRAEAAVIIYRIYNR